jgi:uncharacterized protein DUF6494
MEQFNITMRKYLKEVGVTAQQAIERVVCEEKLAEKGKLKVKMVLTGEALAPGMWSRARSSMIPRAGASRLAPLCAPRQSSTRLLDHSIMTRDLSIKLRQGYLSPVMRSAVVLMRAFFPISVMPGVVAERGRIS